MSVLYVVVLAVGLLGVVACVTAFEPDDPDPRAVIETLREVPVRVSTDRTEYAEGDEMTVAIANESPVEARYTLCPGTWDRQAGEVWLRSEEFMSCSTELGVVQSGATVIEKVTVPSGLLAGLHRVVVHVYGPSDPVIYPAPTAVPSNQFSVAR
jgi:hypothetical protein